MAQQDYDIAPNGLSAMGSTFAERAAYRAKAEKAAAKSVDADDVEDKAVSSAATKTRRKSPKKG